MRSIVSPDGGLVNRTPLEIVPKDRFDELWIAACSPSGIGALESALAEHDRSERLVIVTPGDELPAGRWTMDWPTLERTIAKGREDAKTAIRLSKTRDGTVASGLFARSFEGAAKTRYTRESKDTNPR